MDEILASQKKLDDEGVTNNRHTTLTGKDVVTQHEQYGVFLQRKKEQLEKAIEHERLRGLTQEQIDEIKENFTLFDKDNSGAIDLKELKGCLFSLGYEVGGKEVEKVMSDFGKDGKLDKEGFTNYMIGLVGDTESQEEIESGWKLIAKGDPALVEVERIKTIMEEHDVQYLEKTAPVDGGKISYLPWTKDVFSR